MGLSRLRSVADILGVCLALLDVAELDAEERRLLSDAPVANRETVLWVCEQIRAGLDPLGDAYMGAKDAALRRTGGEVYTPSGIVSSMVDWARAQGSPDRVVDCGCGSGRFALACARAFPNARVVAQDSSPMATLMCKANARAAGLAVHVVRGDFTRVSLPFGDARSTLWIGNPPYVRHHELTAEQKGWFAEARTSLSLGGSGLAGLHAHFVASIAHRYGQHDFGCLVLSSEWMDVGYGATIRDALAKRLGLRYLRLYPKESMPFEGTMTSAVVVGFCAGAGDEVAIGEGGQTIRRDFFARSSRWGDLLAGHDDELAEGFVHLGDFARVHRGVVTGQNRFWVRRPGDVSEQLCVPVVSHARELAGDHPQCRDTAQLSRLVTLPDDLSTLPDNLRREAQGIVDEGVRTGVNEGFVASHRKSWWSIKAPQPPAIMMTYMARHAPTFVVNYDKLAMLNVVHGIYPSVPLSDHALGCLADYLNEHVSTSEGRTYAGGLTKFEPREVERLMVPAPHVLEAM